MRPAIVMPMHDPDGILFPHLGATTPFLKEVFDCAFINLTAVTFERQPEQCDRLRRDPFFRVARCEKGAPPGKQFAQLYRDAASACPPEQALHLGFVDRVVYALGSEHRETFLAEVYGVHAADTPVLYHRSPAAWETHPDTYRRLEGIVTAVGETLLGGRSFDFAWCYMALKAGRLAALMPTIKRSDMSMLAEMVVGLQDQLRVREADWLAWEDPYILGRDGAELKRERETSAADVRKRLGYVIPMLQVLAEWQAADGNG